MVYISDEYDADYFDGRNSPQRSTEGYFEYEKSDHMLGELQRYLDTFNPQVLANQKVLEIGCAKGFFVEKLRENGVEAYGIDISSYAINDAPAAVAPYVSVGDINNLSAYSRNEFDYVISIRTLEVIDPNNLPSVIDSMNLISRGQIHIIDEPSYGESTHYNLQPLSYWQQLPFERGSRIISYQTGEMVST